MIFSFIQPRPVYMPEGKKEKIETVLEEHNTNIVDKDTLNSRVVYKRKIEKLNTPQILSRLALFLVVKQKTVFKKN